MPDLLYKNVLPQQEKKVSKAGHGSLVISHWFLVNRQSSIRNPQSPIRSIRNTIVNRQSSIVNPRGFTLLELIIVTLLISLIIGLSAVFLAGTLSSSKLSSTVREMVTTIRYARTLAQSTGKSQSLLINLDSNAYSIEGRIEKDIPEDINIIVIDNIKGTEISEGTYRLVFNPTGGMEGGRIILYNDKRRVAIETDPITGVRVVE
jgi:general secretion pathway protein H